MDLSFGARLRLQREQKQVPLAAIAEQTKIKMSLLDGLERDDLSHWPGGIFRRSYVRAYAHAIGLEPEAVVGEFLAHYPDPEEDVSSALAARTDEDSSKRPPTRISYLISSAIDALPRRRVPAMKRPAEDALPTGERDGWQDAERREEDARDSHLEMADGDLLDGLGVMDPSMGGMHVAAGPAPELEPEVRAEANDAQGLLDLPLLDEAASPAPSEGAQAVRAVQTVAVRAVPDWLRVAELCTQLSCARDVRQVSPVLADVAALLDAVGVIVWTWDVRTGSLRPAINHGYPDQLLAQLPRVRPDADNAIAAAFRLRTTRVVDGEGANGAVVAPLLTAGGCTGVLALELRNGGERQDAARAIAAILAAQLAMLLEAPPVARAVTA